MKPTPLLALVALAANHAAADDSLLDQASNAYSSALEAASSNFDKAKSIISEQISGTPKPIHEEMLSSADSAYSGAVAAASSRLSAAAASLSSISSSVIPTQGPLESISSVASVNYKSALAAASSQYSNAKVAVGATPTPAAQKILDDARRSYYEAIGYAHEQYDEYVSQASHAMYGPPAGSVESATSAAAENWASLVAAASEKIYGTPTPVYQAYAAQITDSANAQFEAAQSYISELVSGREPAFTESVYSRFSSVYHHNAFASSASSIANEAVASASSVASSVSSVVSAYFAPPEATAALDIFESQLNAAVDAASKTIYGTEPSYYEGVSSKAAEAASQVSEAASKAVYGTKPGYAEAASSSFNEAFATAQAAISNAIYGTTPSAPEVASSYVADSASKASEAAASIAGQVQARVSAAIYGPEVTQGAIESFNSRMSIALASAQSRISDFGAEIPEAAAKAASAVSSAAKSIKDEL